MTDTSSTVSASCAEAGPSAAGLWPRQPLAHRPGPHLPPGPHLDFAGTQPAAGPGKTPAPPARRPAPSAPGPAPAAPTPAALARSAPWCRRPRTHRGRVWEMEGQQEGQGSALSAQCWPVAGGRVDSGPGAGQGGDRAPSLLCPLNLPPEAGAGTSRLHGGDREPLVPAEGGLFPHPHPTVLTWGRAQTQRAPWVGCGAPRARPGPRPPSVRAPGMSSGSRRPPGRGR